MEATSEMATAISDVILATGTLGFGLFLPQKPFKRTWASLFIILAISAACGALFHGTTAFHTSSFWVLVASTAVASAFLFLLAVITVVYPHQRKLNLLWPPVALAGFIVGSLISSKPFYYVSLVSGVCLFIALILLPKSPKKEARQWIYLGIATTLAALLAQKFVNNLTFHYLQLAANLCFWSGAKST